MVDGQCGIDSAVRRTGGRPFLFFHGAKDALVGLEHSEKMTQKLREVGVSAELVVMDGEGHGWGGDKLAKTLDQTARFFQEKLKK